MNRILLKGMFLFSMEVLTHCIENGEAEESKEDLNVLYCGCLETWVCLLMKAGKELEHVRISSFLRMARKARTRMLQSGFHEPKQEKPVLEILCILTSKKTPDSSFQPQCFKELNPLKQHCCPTGTQKLLCLTRALQLKFLHCWLSSDHKELW